MSQVDSSAELAALFKALSDPNRLKIVGLLAAQPYSVEQLAALLGLSASTVSHHLARLAQVGLVSARAEGYYSVYRLEQETLQRARLLFSPPQLQDAAAGVDLDAYDRQVVTHFTRADGSLAQIPAQQKKLEAVLRYVVQAFEPGQRYSEKQVNEILLRYHADTATLRRELVGAGLMQREGGGGDYWRPE